MQSMTDGTPTPEFKKFSDAVLALGIKPQRHTEVEFHFVDVPEELYLKAKALAVAEGYSGEETADYVDFYDSIYRSFAANRSEENSGLWHFGIFDGGEE